MKEMRHLSQKGLTRLVLICVVLLCGHVEGAAQTAQLGREFKVQVGSIATLERGRLWVRLARVASDSRCPVDVTCVWAGNAEVVIEIGKRGVRERQTLTLYTNAGGQGASEGKFGRYTVKLVGLSPQPHSNRKIKAGEYTATLLVVKE